MQQTLHEFFSESRAIPFLKLVNPIWGPNEYHADPCELSDSWILLDNFLICV